MKKIILISAMALTMCVCSALTGCMGNQNGNAEDLSPMDTTISEDNNEDNGGCENGNCKHDRMPRFRPEFEEGEDRENPIVSPDKRHRDKRPAPRPPHRKPAPKNING